MSAFDDYQQRVRQRHDAAVQLTAQQDKSNNDFWGGLGGMIGDGAKAIGNWAMGEARIPQRSGHQTALGNSVSTMPHQVSSFHWPAGDLSTQTLQGNGGGSSSYIDDHRDQAMAGREGMGANVVTPQDRQGSIFDDLLARGSAKWGGVDKSKIDYSPLDKILAARMGLINQMDTQTHQNFDKSDVALQSMHQGLQNDLNTTGVNRYNTIANDTNKQLQGSADTSNQRLQSIKDGDMAKRTAMLKALGIQAAGGQVDPSAGVLTDTQANISAHTADDKALNESDRNGNLAYNQGIVASVGQAGVERRGALQQQLQQVLGKLGQAKNDAQAQDMQSRMQLDQNAEQQQYSEFNNERGYARDTANGMQDRAIAEANAAAKAQGSGSAQKVAGFSGLAADLQNTGYDVPTVQHAVSALSDLLGTQYMQGINPQEYSRADVIAQKLQGPPYNLPHLVASQLATNYGNLGSTSSY